MFSRTFVGYAHHVTVVHWCHTLLTYSVITILFCVVAETRNQIAKTFVIISMSADFSGNDWGHDILVINLHRITIINLNEWENSNGRYFTVFLERATEVQSPIRVKCLPTNKATVGSAHLSDTENVPPFWLAMIGLMMELSNAAHW